MDEIRSGMKQVLVPDDWCENCRGTGKTVLHGAAFTQADIAEALHDEPDFLDNMMSGVYDTACDVCGGSGRVSEEHARAYWEDQAILRMEAPHLFA